MRHLTDFELQSIASESSAALADFDVHLKECSKCRTDLHIYRQMWVCLAESPKVELSPNFSDSVMERIVLSKSKPFDYLEWGLFAVVLLVGCPLVICSVDWSFLLDSTRESIGTLREQWRNPSLEILPLLIDSKAYLVILAALIVAGFDRLGKFVVKQK